MGILRDITERKEYEQNLENALGEKEILIRDIHHRVKNNLLLIIDFLTLELESLKKKHDVASEVENSFENMISRIHILATVYSQLYQSDRSVEEVECEPFFCGLLEQIRNIYPEELHVTIEQSIEQGVTLPMKTMIPLGLITNEILSNSFKYAFDPGEKGNILVILGRKNDGVVLTISDRGKGFSEPPERIKDRSLGLRLIDAFTLQVGGELTVDTENGVTYTIIIR
jgi:two-component sensor histidine kinase